MVNPLPKNVVQVPYISAHEQIQILLGSVYAHILTVYYRQLFHSTRQPAPLFIALHVILAPHSLQIVFLTYFLKQI